MEGRNKVVSLQPPAKINLILKVLDRLPNGYHNLWSLMHTIELEDELEIRLNPHSDKVTLLCQGQGLPDGRENLVHRAAELMLNQVEAKVGVDIVLRKQIPVGAGLGGGSSDAAATILGLNRLLGLGWSVEKMAALGQTLGSDIPFFFAPPSAIVQGWGQKVVPIRMNGMRWIVLVNPGFPIETQVAYQHLDRARKSVEPLPGCLSGIDPSLPLLWEDIIPLMENDFESVLLPLYPVLSQVKLGLLKAGAEGALVSGSGATVFGVFRHEEAAVKAKMGLGGTSGRLAYIVRASSGEPPGDASLR